MDTRTVAERLQEIDLKTADPNDPYIAQLLKLQTPKSFIGISPSPSSSHMHVVCVVDRFLGAPYNHFWLTQLVRYPSEVPDREIINEMGVRFARAPDTTRIIVDATVGGSPTIRAILENPILTGKKGRIHPIFISNGSTQLYIEGRLHLPKTDIISSARQELRNDLLSIRTQIEEGDILRTRLKNYKIDPDTSGSDTAPLWRIHEDDDIVMTVAMTIECAKSEKINSVFHQWTFYR